MKKTIIAALVGLTAMAGAASASEIRIVNHGAYTVETSELASNQNYYVRRDVTGGKQISYYQQKSPKNHGIYVEIDGAGYEQGFFEYPEEGKTLVVEFSHSLFNAQVHTKTIDGNQQNTHGSAIYIR